MRFEAFLLVAVMVGAPAGIQASHAQQPTTYPETRIVDVTHDYHGTLVRDPFNWLEDTRSSEVRDWASAQTAMFESRIRSDEYRARLTARMLQLGEVFDEISAEPSPDRPRMAARLSASPGGDRHLLTADAVTGNGESRTLVDPRGFGTGWDISRIQMSPDQRFVAFALSQDGSEWVETRIFDLAAGETLPDVVTGLLFEPPVWTLDSRGFFYVHNQHSAEVDNRQVFVRAPSIRYHRVRTNQEVDRVIYATPPESTDLMLDVELTPDGRYALVSEGTGAHQDDLGWISARLMIIDLEDPLRPDVIASPVALTQSRDAGYHLVGNEGPILHLLTDRGAPRRRLVAVDLANPAPNQWRDIIPEADAVLQSVTRIGSLRVVFTCEMCSTSFAYSISLADPFARSSWCRSHKSPTFPQLAAARRSGSQR